MEIKFDALFSLLTNGNEVAGADRTSFVPSHVLLGISQETTSSKPTILLSPLGEACSRMDLTAIHEILEKTRNKDDEGIANDLSFQMWTDQIQETLNLKNVEILLSEQRTLEQPLNVTLMISTACLLVILSQVYRPSLGFLSLLATGCRLGKASHKDVKDSSIWLFKLYYGNRMFMGYFCVACESEYQRGVSESNFDIEDLKAQASLVDQYLVLAFNNKI
ncbi:hypothetical protein V6N13_093355 [Hibiscus sabdariffa]